MDFSTFFHTFSPSDKVVTQLTGIIPDPQTNPSKTDTSTIFTSKSKSVLTCFSNFLSDKHGFYFPSALTFSPGLRTLLLESSLVCPLLPLPLASPPQLWIVQQIFALMSCFKRTLTLLLVLIIRIILSTYKFFPSSYAFFIIST